MIHALSFGTGVFLRGFFCDFADRAGISVTMCSSTPEGDRRAARMNAVGGRYYLAYRGRDTDGTVVDEGRIVNAVGRVIPSDDWPRTLALSHDPNISLVVSNVSEAGFRLSEDPADDRPERPRSFPARLVRWLDERRRTLGPDASVTILPCELFEENGSRLRAMLETVARDWGLPTAFFTYLAEAVAIPDTLVDRIVMGEPSAEEREAVWAARLGADAYLPIIVGEPFALWAIEGDAALKNRMASLVAASGGKVIVTPDISAFVRRKVRILNGLHTAMAIIAPREYGLATVREAVEHPELGPRLRKALFEEILPAVVPPLDEADARAYAGATWARFGNPFLEHKFSDINKGADMKWPVRVAPTIDDYRERFGVDPPFLSYCRDLRPSN
ncbi:MAG: hypothetical protein SFU56_08260 [Capsulimonadales bacterium]|nr:hypothetical protein [Capsulimonadales bacterium]